MFARWEEIGFFSYLLPFLLIFALVFGILTKVKLFKENKAVNGIIALVVALMAVQFQMVPAFFSQIFPRMGIALAIILGLFILIGLFIDPDHPAMTWILFGIGTIIFIVVIVQSAGALGWSTGTWWQDNWVTVIGVVVVVALVVAVIAGSSGKGAPAPKSVWGRGFSGGKPE
jgi:peptidoglycan/LPS O-acetylase OafA/YrhL